MLPALIAGGMSLIGGIMGNRSRSKEARNTEAFQERMSNTTWQRGIEDMKKAGVNPALAYSQGGASSPSGALAQQSDVISPSVTSAQHARRLEKELKLLDDQSTNVYEDSRLKRNQAAESATRRSLIERQQTTQDLTNELAGLQMFSARNLANLERGNVGKVAPYVERIMRMAPSINLMGLIGGRRSGPKGGPMSSMTERRR